MDVNLYWMDEVLKAMKKYKPTIPSNVRGCERTPWSSSSTPKSPGWR